MNVNKIEKYGLEDEVKQMKDMGYSYKDIAHSIKESHPKNGDLQKLSSMSIMRFLKTDEERQMSENLDMGMDPIKKLNQETRLQMKKIDERCEQIYDESLMILDEAKQKDDIDLKIRALKCVRDDLSNLMKNKESIMKTYDKQIKVAGNLNLKKEVHVKNMILGISNNLCPECKRNIQDVIEEMLNK